MPFYFVKLDIPANTTEADKVVEKVQAIKGIVHKILVIFPPGSAGLAHVRVRDGNHPIAPSSLADNFSGDNLQIEYNDFYEISEWPKTLSVEGWNLDDTYAHSVFVGFGILPKWVLLPTVATLKLLDLIGKVFPTGRTIR